jgi:hypothetical protein
MTYPFDLLESMFTIGVRYCGGCNPLIDRSRIVMDLREGLKKMGREVNLTTEKEGPVDMALMVNGCRHACLEAKQLESDRGDRVISVKGEMVDDQYVEEGDIVKILIKRICSFL